MSTSPIPASRRAVFRPRFLVLSGLAAPALGLLLGSLASAVPTPAAAQFFSPYYDDAPGYDYGPPRSYRRYRAPAPEFSANDVRPMLRSMGFVSINPARVAGNAYVTEATDADGVRLRVRVDRYSGEVISMRPIGSDRAERAPLPPAPVRNPPKKPPAPKTAALPPAVPLPPPAAGGDAGTVSPDAAVPPAAAAPGAAPETSTAVTPPEAKPTDARPAEARPAEDKPAEVKPAPAPAKEAAAKPEPAKPEPSKAEPPIRVIPTGPNQAGSAAETPPPVADAKKGTGAGTGTPSGAVSAGTASVLSRDATKKPAEPKPKTSSN